MNKKETKVRLGYNKGGGFFQFVSTSGNDRGYKGLKIFIYLFKRLSNYLFHLIAQFMPFNGWRVFFHRIRGVAISPKVQIGTNVWIDESFPEYVKIETGVAIAIGSMIIAHSIPSEFFKDRFVSFVSPVVLKEYAWIGMGSIILPGITVGKGSVISAGSIVTRDVPPFTVVRGNPAKIVGKVRRKPEER